MKLFNIIAILITLTAAFSYVNYKFVRLPNTIGIMILSLLASLALIGLNQTGMGFESHARLLLESIDFDDTLLHGMLSFLLFAGAIHVNLNDMAKQKWIIGLLATFSVIASTILVGFSSRIVLAFFGIQLPLIVCLLFGALISPTDPIAVLGILKKAGITESIETKISGESLFNDGVAVVVFLVILEIYSGGHPVSAPAVISLFMTEAVGGVLFGLCIGFIAYWLLKQVDNYQVEILITLALVSGGYALANALHLSGPIAMVVAGLLIGNHGRLFAMSEQTREHLDMFWELIDEVLNSVLFMLIGFEIIILTFTRQYLAVSILMIPVLLFARLVSISIPVMMLKPFRKFSPGVITILTWGGLRGGISVAMALSLPAGQYRDVVLAITYVIVVFSIIVQGLTIGTVSRNISKKYFD